MSSTDTPSKPSLFNASLFSTPSTATSGGLSSLGFGDDIFAGGSPFTLAPAAPLQQSNTVTPTKSIENKPTSSEDTEELSTIPLDSPSLAQMNKQASSSLSTQPLVTPGSVHGWNDPPFISSIMPQHSSTQPMPDNLPLKDSVPDSTLDIQPLVEQRRSESPHHIGPIPPQGPPTSDTGVNPYRLGGKRQTFNATPIYSQSPPVSSAPTNLLSNSHNVSESAGIGPHQQPSLAPVQPHWFYLRSNEQYWFPFSIIDSNKLEEAYIRSQADSSLNMKIQTDGGRYDVNVNQRQRCAVYWEEPIAHVRRCTWFYKGESDQWYIPYEEEIAIKLEEAFASAVVRGNWNCRVELSNGEAVVIHSPTAMVHYSSQYFQPLNHEVDYYQPKSVLRGFVEREKVQIGEDRSVDHLVFVVHGVGPFVDIGVNSFKSLIDCVDDFREVAQLMSKTHKFGGQILTNGRVEFLPVYWHEGVHTNVDKCIHDITLPSISRFRDFTNSTLIDILFYTSPLYFQTIINQVASEINRMMELFKQRNPGFNGSVALMGHSLGSCILFDLLSHQTQEASFVSVVDDTLTLDTDDLLTEKNDEIENNPTLLDALTQLGLPQLSETFEKEMIDFDSLILCNNEDLKDIGIPLGARKKLSTFIDEWSRKKQLQIDKKVKEAEEKLAKEKEMQFKHQQLTNEEKQGLERFKYVKGLSGIGEPSIVYPQLSFKPCCLFAIGSPIGLFLTIRGVQSLGPDYSLPTCPFVLNIFHPFDPIAYRLEPLVISSPPLKAVLMPHHKGRKRFHLELYDNIERMSQSVRYHLVESIRNMWNQLNELARAHTSVKEEESDVVQAEISSQGSVDESANEQMHIPVGQLNGGNRIDYVLQEKPIEKINEYLFALSSHLCYWRSEDTALFVLKQMYNDSEFIKS